MKNITVIGIDIAKNFMQIHGTNREEAVLLKKRASRTQFLSYMAKLPRCVVGMEACGGAHYWARELERLGFTVKLMSPKKVKKYVEHQKNDAKDAEACAIAVVKKNMRFVSIKTEQEQAIQSLHRIRSHYIKSHTEWMNMVRGQLLEFGIAIPKGEVSLKKKITELLLEESALPPLFREWLEHNYQHLQALEQPLEKITRQIEKIAKEDERCVLLQTIDGVGPISSSAVVAKIGNGSEFQKGRELSAFLGIVPRQYSSGDKEVLGGITKHGDRYIRQLLIHGGRSVLKAALRKNKLTGLYIKNDSHSLWIRQVYARRGWNKTCVAIANKNARLAIAVLKKRQAFKPELAH